MTDVLFGRETELQGVDRFFDLLNDGGFAACVIEGDAGIGKTAIWRATVARAHASSGRVLSCAPAEAEAALSYASLADLLDEVEPDVLASLPDPQRNAIEVALLRVTLDDAVAGQRAIATAVVSVLTELAASGPLLLAVDDVQWLDRASARVLEFAARRLERHRVAYLVSMRTGGPMPLGLDRSLGDQRLERIRVGPLSAGALHQLIKARLGATFSRAELLRIQRSTSGNPFFALELAAALVDAGSPTAGKALPVPPDVRGLVVGRLRRLPQTTRELLLFSAAMSDPTVGALQSAVRASPKELVARLAGAEAAGVIAVDGESVRFMHPLFASAIYGAAPHREQHRVHRRLADMATNREQRARHLALCTDQPNADVATAVSEAAGEVRRRGAPEAAVELAELAVRLTPPGALEERDRRALELGYYLVEAGDPERARGVILPVADSPGPLRARALLDLAGVDYWGKGSRPAVVRCEEALAAAAGDGALEATCHAELAVYCDFDAARSERHAHAALTLLDALGEEADPDTLVDALLATTRARLILGLGLSHDLIERALHSERLAEGSIHRSRVGAQVGQWLKYVDDFAGSRARLERALSQTIAEGDEGSMPNQLMHLAQLECWSGDWSLASRYAEESVELAEQVGQSFGGPPAISALVDAHLGRVERARATVATRLEVMEDDAVAVPLYLRVLGFLALSLGDASGAVEHLSRTVEIAESFGIREPAVFRVHADLIEALIANGELERAEAVLGQLEARARESRIPWSLVASARCRGLLLSARGELDEAEHMFEGALATHAQLPMPFEHGRTLLAHGQLQRRRNKRRVANDSLEQARGIFAALGATLWEARAERELRSTGGRPTSRLTLTPAEQRVAELAASGLTNRQMAAALFISPKTVESRLARVYRKLDIRTRAELGGRIPADRPH